MKETYQGWTNYPTWAVALDLDNDSAKHAACLTLAQHAWKDAAADESFSRTERATWTLAELLKECIEEASPLAEQASLFADLLDGALAQVHWNEIARHYLDKVREATETPP